jgi:fatty acid desaturase
MPLIRRPAHQGANRADPDRRQPPRAAAWKQVEYSKPERRPIVMPALIVFAVIAVVALIVVSAIVHFLFSPWLLVLAVAALAYYKFGPRRARR